MSRFKVLVPRGGRALEEMLGLDLFDTARAALRLLADDPWPPWSAPCASGRCFVLPNHSVVLYDVDDEERLVTVLGVRRV